MDIEYDYINLNNLREIFDTEETSPYTNYYKILLRFVTDGTPVLI